MIELLAGIVIGLLIGTRFTWTTRRWVWQLLRHPVYAWRYRPRGPVPGVSIADSCPPIRPAGVATRMADDPDRLLAYPLVPPSRRDA